MCSMAGELEIFNAGHERISLSGSQKIWAHRFLIPPRFAENVTLVMLADFCSTVFQISEIATQIII